MSFNPASPMRHAYQSPSKSIKAEDTSDNGGAALFDKYYIVQNSDGQSIFDGGPGQDAKRWLSRLCANLKRNDITEPRDVLNEINNHLGGAPAQWAESDSRVKDFFDESKPVSDANLATVKAEFIDNWHEKQDAEPNAVQAIMALEQGENESLRQYFQRASHWLTAAGGRDTVGTTQGTLNQSMLDMVCKKWAKGIHDPELRKHMNRVASNGMQTLGGMLDSAESQSRIFKEEQALLIQQHREEKSSWMEDFITRSLTGGEISLEDRQKAAAVAGIDFDKMPLQSHVGRLVHANAAAQGGNSPLQRITASPGPSNQTVAQTIATSKIEPYQAALEVMAQQVPGWEAKSSKNGYVNGSVQYKFHPDHALCVRCGGLGHLQRHCIATALSRPETDFLWKMTEFQRNKGRATKDVRELDLGGLTVSTNLIEIELGDEDDGVAFSNDSLVVEVGNLTADVNAGETVAGPSTKGSRAATAEPQAGQTAQTSAKLAADTSSTTLKCTHLNRARPFPHCREKKCTHECCRQWIEAGLLTTESLELIQGQDQSQVLTRTRKRRQPRIINGMVGKPPVDVDEILDKTIVSVPITGMCQLSPAFNERLRWSTTVPRKPRSKKVEASPQVVTGMIEAQIDEEAPAQIDDEARIDDETQIENNDVETLVEVLRIGAQLVKSIEGWQKQSAKSHRSFTLPVTAWRMDPDKAVELPRDAVIADQGSDINLVYPSMDQYVKLKMRPISQLNLPTITMRVADGTRVKINRWTYFRIDVEGIRREVWAFVCPTQGSKASLLLGLPYLKSVAAKIDVQKETIKIGDRSQKEKRVLVRTSERDAETPQITAEPEDVKAALEEAYLDDFDGLLPGGPDRGVYESEDGEDDYEDVEEEAEVEDSSTSDGDDQDF